jgi:hypothetical protein
MNIIRRTGERVLLSLTSVELDLIEEALSHRASSTAAQACLSLLREQVKARPVSEEADILDVWADGVSVQVRAITAYADPVDLGSEEARAFAQRILACAREAD